MIKKVCNEKAVKKKLPFLQWLPNYTIGIFIQDLIAGLTVGLTAIPQSMAYAGIAGIPTEYGLYSGMLGGFVYIIFGNCKDVSIGPTAILSTLLAKHIAEYNVDFAILAAFLTGITVLVMGIFHLGFLAQYISKPVISGFTNAAAFQIMFGQFKSLCGYDGPAGSYFAESVVSFVQHVKGSNVMDTVVGLITIVLLLLMKKLGDGCDTSKTVGKRSRWYFSLSRNALVVVFGIILTYSLKLLNFGEPVTVTGEILKGLPKFQPPPFNTVIGNTSYNFIDMVDTLGPGFMVIPLVAALEIIAVASAFSESKAIDISQEMIALGIGNILSSFIGSMPITSAFSRAALSRSSGSQTPATSLFTGCLIILALTLLPSILYFIPKTVLAAIVIVAMFSLLNLPIIKTIWYGSKCEFFVMLTTMVVCLFVGLEYGIITGVIIQALILLYSNSKPDLEVSVTRSEKNIVMVQLPAHLTYCSVGHVRRNIIKASESGTETSTLVINGTHLKDIDFTITLNLMTICKVLEKKHNDLLFLNFNTKTKNLCLNVRPDLESKFVDAPNVSDFVNSVGKVNYDL